MTKTRNFSIFLLKEEKTLDDLFSNDAIYDNEKSLKGAPEAATFFLVENAPKPPWWGEYFSLDENLEQTLHGAFYVLPVEGRLFCICFGPVAHYIDDDAYEYDFGIRVTLNCIDPRKLKSTDTVDPGPSLRQKTQIPLEADLTFFDFDYESDVLKSLTGKVQEQYKSFFRHATGSSNLRIGSSASLIELGELCQQLLALYESNDFEQTFPGLRNISPIKDPSILKQLNEELLQALRTKNLNVNLMVPDLINYHLNVYASFSGNGSSNLFDEVYIGRYYEYLNDSGQEFSALDMQTLKKHYLCLSDENETVAQKYAMLKCFVFDTILNGEVYHLRERQWYKISKDYIAEMKAYLDPLMGDRILPEYHDKTEGDYNKRIAEELSGFVCMDKLSISPIKSNPIEPCDLYTIDNNRRVFMHVKISTLSATLSHHFNQGINPIQFLKTEKASQTELSNILKKANLATSSLNAFKQDDFSNVEVCYAIITRKEAAGRSDNLPLFSRISLMRAFKQLKSMSVERNYIFVKDATPSKPGKKKPRKKKSSSNPVPF